MQQLIEKLEKKSNWKEIMRSACKNNHICTSMAGQLTPNKLRLFKTRFQKAYETRPQQFYENWIEHELKAFTWVLIAVSSEKNVKIEDFDDEEWNYLFQIFDKKSASFLRYETHRFLVQKKIKNKNWSPDEDQILLQMIPKYENNKIPWNEVARLLFQASNGKYFRTAKHCRQHWFNYLDPSKKRTDWKKEEDMQLLEKVEKEGKKWAKFGAQFHRTEHNIKNRYNSLISKQRKIFPQIKKEENLRQSLKQSFQDNSESEKEEKKQVNPIKVHFKTSSESLFNENKSPPFITFHEIQPKNPLDMIQGYNPEGEEHIKHLLKEEDPNNKTDLTLPSFWAQSPQNITPLGFSPSPFSFNMSCNYYINHFNMQLQRQEEGKK